MSLYTIGDTHLSLGTNKPMDVFGGRWENYVQKLNEGFAELNDDDLTVLCGDITWGMTMDEALPDFKFIDALPGRKIILKGNHDYWWTTATKARGFFAKHDINTIDVMHNSSFEYDGVSICGTRGWFYEESKGAEHDKKIYVFLHYPPKYMNYTCPEILELLKKYNVKRCCYGHIHGAGCQFAFNGMLGGVDFMLVSADHVKFRPVKLI